MRKKIVVIQLKVKLHDTYYIIILSLLKAFLFSWPVSMDPNYKCF